MFNFTFEKKDKKEIKIIIQEINKDNAITSLPYISVYNLDYLNERLGKIITFNKMKHFINCLIDNLNKKTLIVKPPYKSAIATIWKIYPKDPKKKNTFTLISSSNYDKGLSLIFFGDNKDSKNIIKEIEKVIQNNNPIENIEKLFLEYIYNDRLIRNAIILPIDKKTDKEIISDFSEIMKMRNDDSGKILIFFDDPNLDENIKKIFDKFYKEPIFVVVFTNGDVKQMKKKINKLSNLKKPFVDIDNFFIFENKSEYHKKIVISILKVFSYYNQLGDGFFKDMNLQIEGLEQEFKHLTGTHYFNILLCGRTGTGKSTFINKFMGEKKSFTLKTKSTGTFRNNYYIHRKYPIKIIDVCGFAEGSEGKDNFEKMQSIYNKNLDNIIIDQSLSDIFDFYEDKRNNIHLLLYFNIYDDKYDVLPGEMPVIIEAIEKKIPILFLVNKCPDEVFEDDNEDFINDLKDIINDSRKDTIYQSFETFFINCLNGNGFDKLLEGIYKKFSKYIIKQEDLNMLNQATIDEKHFKTIFKDSFFFVNIEPQYYLLNDSLISSIKDIQTLVIKLASYYSKELGFFRSVGFYLFSKIYNNIHRNSDTNFFPLLTDLVKKIYSNFNIKKNNDECNNFIKLKISQYFDIDLNIDKSQFNKYELNEIYEGTSDGDCNPAPQVQTKIKVKQEAYIPETFNDARFQKFKQDYINLGKLFWNSRPNFRPKDEKEKKNIEETEKLGDSIFSNIDIISRERIFQLIERDFGQEDSKRDATNEEKIILKLFYISYTCNELISSITWTINQEGYTYKLICEFYYKISKAYNDAINGFSNIIKDMEAKKEENEI